MHSETLVPTTSTNDHDRDHDLSCNSRSINSLSTTSNSHNHDFDDDNKNNDQILNEFDDEEIVLVTDPEPGSVTIIENNPPDSFWVSNNKVNDWLNQHTFIERKASVKLVQASRKTDPTQTRSSQRSVSFNQKLQTTIIGFRQKPGHINEGKPKPNDRPDSFRLFKNRSVPGKSSGLVQVTEPKSPRVSCIGRVGSMRGRARKTGFWKSVKAAILNRVRMNKVKKTT
uniref:Serine/threonine-protein kinase pakA-like n=1 Tax=Tanacetum cinerariifolium TaxID=118510 RepID=A0A6L2P067_TANCI|nr:serine/threonine-protein kinase pakA-like [Tanacetum cinerariifolium]